MSTRWWLRLVARRRRITIRAGRQDRRDTQHAKIQRGREDRRIGVFHIHTHTHARHTRTLSRAFRRFADPAVRFIVCVCGTGRAYYGCTVRQETDGGVLYDNKKTGLLYGNVLYDNKRRATVRQSGYGYCTATYTTKLTGMRCDLLPRSTRNRRQWGWASSRLLIQADIRF